MHNFLVTLSVIVIAIISLTVGSNLSTYARTMQTLKEDVEVAVHDASLQIDVEQYSEGLIVIDYNQALHTFKESFELNTGFSEEDYIIEEFQVFDHSNTTFPVEFSSESIDFNDTFFYPTVLAIVTVNTTNYFYNAEEKPVTRVASYSYKIENKYPIRDIPVGIGEPNENGFYWALPYTTNITSYFTPYRINPITKEIEFHKGIDISSQGVFDKPVVSVKDGIVTYSGSMGSYGNLVEISHDNGLVTRYAHLNRLLVSSGQRVSGGDVIGTVGTTGQSTGYHLHFETILNGEHVDPLSFY